MPPPIYAARRRHPRHAVPHHRRRRAPLPVHAARHSLGFALGVGRLGAVLAPQVGGLLLNAGLGVGSNFLAFSSIAAGLAAVLLDVTAVVTKPTVSPRPVADVLVH